MKPDPKHHRPLNVKEALDAVYATESSKLDQLLQAMQAASVAEDWAIRP